jgi:hypothetical protein
MLLSRKDEFINPETKKTDPLGNPPVDTPFDKFKRPPPPRSADPPSSALDDNSMLKDVSLPPSPF